MKDIFDNLEVLSTYYKLKQRDINVIHTLLTKHTTYNAYIQVKSNDFKENRRTLYRSIDSLKEKNIIVVVERPVNQHGFTKLYFTTDFIKRVCGEEVGNLYERWFDWQNEFKEKKGEEN